MDEVLGLLGLIMVLTELGFPDCETKSMGLIRFMLLSFPGSY